MENTSHDIKLAHIVEQLKNHKSTSLSLRKDAVSHMVPNPNDPKHKDQKISIRGLNRILKIDTEKKICIAEPGVTFSDLVKETLPLGFIPCLVPELKTITLGGAVSGCSVESMSYKYGGFHDSCLEYEVVTAKGKVLQCSSQQNADIFHMLHGSYGTLGILTKLTFRLISAKPYVKMNYICYPTFADVTHAILEYINLGSVDFIDSIIHARDKNILCLGRFVDHAPWTSDYTFLNIFYKSTLCKTEDYLSTYDYLFRYDTECHWLSKTIPGMETKPMRFLFGKFILSSTNLLTWSKRLAPLLKHDKRPDVVVDVFIPKNQLEKFYDLYEKHIGYYPLWVLPYKRVQKYPWVNDNYDKKINDDLFFDIAIYGLRNRRRDVNYYKLLEEMVYECNGLKTLISHNFYNRETFWNIYNQNNYTKIKQRTDPHNLFRNLYDKFHF
ncbi:MAG: hypothetical protein A3I05_09620 [Deltaproteobacteria bacterium RIFCSPLOWO2_02_FULL_44_10]|nr:MAG: hypothetical protein A3C46_00075 [Deltaproteobacteria bacterium RIFCSPHIGHO2_02_FULL_44_16]OGQ46823.1 MAG: hypothetical protein A3I05_09620 [Deltaproteobacteria bacterium RIFCSPLOWO2_02_FULL_44_10]